MSEQRRVEYHPAAAKSLRHMDRVTSERIRAKVRQLADDPKSLARNITRMKGEDGLLRLRVGDWRVIYTESLVILLVLKVAPRSGAYD